MTPIPKVHEKSNEDSFFKIKQTLKKSRHVFLLILVEIDTLKKIEGDLAWGPVYIFAIHHVQTSTGFFSSTFGRN